MNLNHYLMKRSLELPNQKKVYVLNEKEALFLYDDIFVRQSYLQHGITLKQGGTVFDIGANIGLFTLFAYQYCQDNINVFAFEPIYQLYKILEGNAKSAVVINSGLWDKDSEAIFDYFPRYSLLSGADATFSSEEKKNFISLILDKLDDSRNKDSLIGNIIRICPSSWKTALVTFILENFFLKARKCKVTLTSLSKVIKEHNLSKIDLVKLDAEKAELKILEGIESSDWQKIQQFVIEIHDIQNRLNIMKAMLEEHGFQCTVETGYPPKFLAYSILGVTDPVFANHNSQDLLYTLYAKRI